LFHSKETVIKSLYTKSKLKSGLKQDYKKPSFQAGIIKNQKISIKTVILSTNK